MAIYRRQQSKNWISQFMIDGKTYIRSTKTTHRKLALEFDKAHYQEIYERDVLGYKDTISFGDAMEIYEISKQGTTASIQLSKHRALIEKHINPKRLLHEVQDQHIHRLVLELRRNKRSENTIRLYLSTLRGIIKAGEQHGYRVPTVTFPVVNKVNKRVRYLSSYEEQMLLSELNPERRAKGFGGSSRKKMLDLRHFTICLLDTGCRYNEMATLPASAVDMEHHNIHIYRTKTQNESIIRMTNRVFRIMRDRFDDGIDRYVFASSNGDGHRNYRTEAFARACDRAGLNTPQRIAETGSRVSFHTLRHTFASRLALAGVSLYKISKLLGHTDISTTQKYAHLASLAISEEASNVLNHTMPPEVNISELLEF
jgi:site-specific recombinase XerD